MKTWIELVPVSFPKPVFESWNSCHVCGNLSDKKSRTWIKHFVVEWGRPCSCRSCEIQNTRAAAPIQPTTNGLARWAYLTAHRAENQPQPNVHHHGSGMLEINPIGRDKTNPCVMTNLVKRSHNQSSLSTHTQWWGTLASNPPKRQTLV